MSSRQLRKIQKQKELEALRAQELARDSEGSGDDVPAPKTRPGLFSSFAALGDQDEHEDDEEARDDEEDEEEPSGGTLVPTSTPSQDPAPKSSKKSKKKKKKAKKSGCNKSQGEARSTTKEGGHDEIDRALRELRLSEKTPEHDFNTPVAQAYERICELLQINTHHLKVINEMRILFGREAIAAAENEEGEEHARSQRHQRPLQQNVDLETFLKGEPGKALPEVTLRRNPFLPGKDTWPRAPTEGLTMKQVDDGIVLTGNQYGLVEFAFSHDQNYNNLEAQFFTLVQMLDPMQLVHFLHRHPYHISSLIQVSKVAKQDQNSALAADLCERALFTFGRVSLSAFRQKITEGKARLDFSRPENRQFWLAGYFYLKSLVLKGTYRTALEWAKLLFSLDLYDPYGLIHFIHPLAIRAHESKWFIDFCDSQALDECETAQDYIRQTLVLARLQQKDKDGAKALAVEGMQRLPWLYSSLFKALNLDVPKAIWGIQPLDDVEALFTELYIYQTKGLWDNTEATALLREASRVVTEPSPNMFAETASVADNVGRFVYLDNTPQMMSHLPAGMLNALPNWDFDPLPPAMEENIFSYDSQKLPWMPSGAHTLPPGLPTNARALRRILERARQEGVPRDIQQIIQDALGADDAVEEEQGNQDDAGEEDDDEGDRDLGGGVGGVLYAIMGLLNAASRPDPDNGYDDMNSEDWETAHTMPGAWAVDSDDDMGVILAAAEADAEMPPLIPSNDNDHTNDSTDEG